MAVDLDLVVNLERLPQQNEEPGEPVLEDVLEGKTNRDRADAETGDEVARFQGRNHDRGGEEKTEQEDHRLDETAEDAAEIAPIAASGLADNEASREQGQAIENREEDKGDDDVRQEPAGAINPAIETFPRAGEAEVYLLLLILRRGGREDGQTEHWLL